MRSQRLRATSRVASLTLCLSRTAKTRCGSLFTTLGRVVEVLDVKRLGLATRVLQSLSIPVGPPRRAYDGSAERSGVHVSRREGGVRCTREIPGTTILLDEGGAWGCACVVGSKNTDVRMLQGAVRSRSRPGEDGCTVCRII
jgi:hypothetical protein